MHFQHGVSGWMQHKESSCRGPVAHAAAAQADTWLADQDYGDPIPNPDKFNFP